MKKMMITIGAAGSLLMMTSCLKGGIFNGVLGDGTDTDSVIDGGHGIGIDTATINMMEISMMLDSIEGDTIVNDNPAPNDKLHSEKHIKERVNAFYKLMDDQQCCSNHYLKIRALAEKKARIEKKDLTEAHLLSNHWTLANYEDDLDENWSYQILGVTGITMHRAEVLVDISQQFGSKMKLHLVLENGDWRVDNFDMVTQTGYDAVVEVYEEQEVYYNELEMMIDYIRGN